MNIRIGAGWLAHVFKASTRNEHIEYCEHFDSHLPDEAVIFDVGAHAGQFSKLFARMRPQGHIYAFEPSPYARSVLQPALRFNRISNVTVVPAGLSDAPGVSVLRTPIKSRGGMGFGRASLGEGETRTTVATEVQLLTIDEFVDREGLDRLDFIKADIEGWEAHMLRGAKQALERFRPAIFLEVDDQLLAGAGERPEAIWSLLGGLGYQAVKADCWTPSSIFSGTGDYLFSRQKT